MRVPTATASAKVNQSDGDENQVKDNKNASRDWTGPFCHRQEELSCLGILLQYMAGAIGR